MPDQSQTPPAFALTKTLSLIVIALIVAAICYGAWAAIHNWSHIGV